MNACIKALSEIEGVEVFVANEQGSDDAPFDEALYSWIETRYQWKNNVNKDQLIARLQSFRPDLILASNWHNSGYRAALKYFEKSAVRIFGMDNQWMGSAKQWLGVFTSRLYLHPICDAVFVAGERQVQFARKLGFSQNKILRGIYSCDHEKFAEIHRDRQNLKLDPCSFVYVGRLSSAKGVDVLVEAYRRYSMMVPQPWGLKCYGAGPLTNLLEGVEGIEYRGFCQPENLPHELSMSSCLILPSTFEAWGLVVHEATSAGMPVISSDAVGASVHLIQDGYNGYIFESGDVDGLSRSMLHYSTLSKTERLELGANSFNMSLQYTPKQWANTLVVKGRDLMEFKSKIT